MQDCIELAFLIPLPIEIINTGKNSLLSIEKRKKKWVFSLMF